MNTIENKIAGRLWTRRAAATIRLKLGLWLVLAGLAGTAGANPANDSFANAAIIAGASGTTNGSNVGATLEPPCETNQVYCDDDQWQSVDNSAWYAWTAPSSGTAEFDTIGSGFDTVLSVWTTTNGLCDASLTNVISDDDSGYDVSGNYDPLTNNYTSRLTFPAVAGTTYYISVDGNALDFGDDSGSATLNWNLTGAVVPTIASGTFEFTKNLYVVSELDSTGPRSATVYPSVLGARVTVTRVGGSSGRVMVDYNTVAQTYTNTFATNYYGTNIFAVGTNANNNNIVTNLSQNFILYSNYYQSYINGGYENYLVAGALTNSSAQIYTYSNSYFVTNYPLRVTNLFPAPTNYPPATNYAFGVTNIAGLVTNIFYTNIFSLVATNSTNGVTHTNGTTITNSPVIYTNFANYWTNTFVTNTYGTNIAISYNLPGGGGYSSNRYSTNIVITGYYYTNSIYTNGLLSTNIVFTNGPTILSATNYFAEIDSNNFVSFTTNYSSGNGPLIPSPANAPPLGTFNLGFGTNSYSYRISVSQGINASGAFSTNAVTLVFDDYQMSQDILVPVAKVASPNGAAVPGISGVIGIQLSNPRLDANESSDLEPPTLSPTGSNATINALSTNYPPGPAIFNFERSTFRVDKDQGTATISVYRTGNLADSVSVDYIIDPTPTLDGGGAPPSTFNAGRNPANQFPLQAGSDYATPDSDYTPVTGTLNWGVNDVSIKHISIPILNNGLVENNEDFWVQLYNPLPKPSPTDIGAELGLVNYASTTILFDDAVCGQQPAGAMDRCWNTDGNLAAGVYGDADLQYPGTQGGQSGAAGGNSGTVYAVAEQPDGKTIIAGSFSSYDAHLYNNIVRALNNGYQDSTWQGNSSPDNNSGANNYIAAVIVQPDGKVLIGGNFTSFNGYNRYHVARLNTNGSVDTAFMAGTNGTSLGVRGTNAIVLCMALETNGQVVIAGNFTSVNGTNCNSVARLNADGSLDASFNPGIGPDGAVNSVVVDSLGRVIIGGEFENVAGVLRGGVARLNVDGSLDTAFNPGVGTYNPDTGYTDPVYALALQPDGQLLVGGSMSYFQLASYNGIVRLNPDGSVDTAFNPGSSAYNGTYNPVTGVADTVSAITLQPDGTILVGGDFIEFNQTRRVGLARLFSYGSVDTSFMDIYYNQFAGVPNHYHNPDAIDTTIYPSGNTANFVDTIAIEPGTTNVIIGGGFLRVGGGATREDIHPRSNVARLIGGGTPGPGNIAFAFNQYSADKSQGTKFVEMVRTNGSLGPASVLVSTNMNAPGPGIATADDFSISTGYENPLWPTLWSLAPGNSWLESPALTGPNYLIGITALPYVYLTINNNSNFTGNVNANLNLSEPDSPFFLGGEKIPLGVALGWQDAAPLTIIDDNFLPGVLGFSSPTYTVNENGTTATITVVRTNFTGGVVQVSYATSDGTATNGADYTSTTGTLTFQAADSSKTFTVSLAKHTTYQSDKTVNLMLYTPAGGATLGLTNAVLTIVNNNSTNGHIGFVSATYTANETDGTALIGVSRLGGSEGTINVTLVTGDGTATNSINYVATTTNLTWNNGEVDTKTVSIPMIHDGVFTTNLTVNLWLTNGVLNSVTNYAVLGSGGTNAVLNIVNVDFPGTLEFSANAYSVKKYGGFALIPVIRTGGSAGTVAVNYATADGSALAGVNYTATNNTLTFTNGQVAEYFNVPITASATNGLVSLNLVLTNAVVVGNATPWNAMGSPSNAVLNIIDTATVNENPGSPDVTYNVFGFNGPVYALALEANNQLMVGGDFTFADGVYRQRIARLNEDGSLDAAFSLPSSTMGADATVRAVAVQADGRILVGGYFTNMNSVAMHGIARLNSDGSRDSLFNSGSGADSPVYAVAQTFVNGSAKILVGGSFAYLNGVLANGIGRLNNDGTPDTSFNVGGLGANGTVYALAVYPTNSPFAGRILIGGDFTQVNGINASHIARLNADGSVDASFTNASASDSVRAIAIQLDGQILAGGLFTSAAGNTNFNHIARFNSADGSADNSFTPGLGANNSVLSIVVQTDGRIVVGGTFTQASGVTRNRITRLNPDGTVDPTVNFGVGADSFVAAIAVEESAIAGYPTNVPDEKIIIGGGFLNYFGQSHPYLARIYGGSIGGSGAFEFSSAYYGVNENGTNVVITINRTGGTSGTNADGSGSVYVAFAATNGTAVAGVNYTAIVTNLSFPMGEIQETVTIPVMDDNVITNDLTVNLSLTPAAPAQYGNQPTAVLTITNVDSAISFTAASYQVNKYGSNVLNGFAPITVNRLGATYGTSTVVFNTLTNGGTATPGVDYQPQSNVTVTFAPGTTVQQVNIPIINGVSDGNTTVNLQLTNVTGSALYSPSNAVLTILDRTLSPGFFVLSATNYVVSEGGGVGNTSVLITVLRTNGASGIVTVNYSTADGTALAGPKYAATSGFLTFGDGVMSQSFSVPVVNTPGVEPTEFFTVLLTNAAGGATLMSPSNATVTILNTNTGIAFAAATNTFIETLPFATINVVRYNNTQGTSTINYSTTNGTALAGTNYVASSGTLTFNSGASQAAILIPLIYDTNVTGPLQFTVGLSNPSSGVQIGTPGTSTVILQDADTGLSFTTNSSTVLKNAGSEVVAVICSNPNVEPVSVSYATSDGTAVAGKDYTATSGTLSFTNGIATNTFSVPIINNGAVNGSHVFYVSLSNPTGTGRLVPPTVQTNTIIDGNSGLNFSSAAYTVFKTGGAAVITVIRTDNTNTVTTVNFTATNGTAVNGLNYYATNGTLVFSNGVTSQAFNVPVIDTTTVQPDKTVLLALSSPSPVNSSILLAPSSATLTIRDNTGSYVIPAGSQMVTNYTSLSDYANDIIGSNDTVQVLFAFRDAAGQPVTNLIATLLATNGVTSPIPSSQVYGPLTSYGHSVSMPFTFTALGTNNQQIAATFKLQDGTNSIGTQVFGYTLGTSSAVFSNSAAIVINAGGAASPYPSVINVGGVGGSLIKAAVTLNRFSQVNPHGVSALVTAPAGMNTLIMSHAGGSGYAVTNLVLTFDDAATNSLPSSGAITNGTYKPTYISPPNSFP